MKRKGTGPDGLVVVDKPAGVTSHHVVSRMRRLARTRKVGHAGTLDPMATGVLIIGVEKATRLLGHLMLTRKTYEATIRLGQDTVTDDAEGEVTASAGASGLGREAVEAGCAKLTGDIEQVPSKVSAIKIDGKRSYARVRSGEDVELAARPVTVDSFEVRDVREAVAEDGTAVVDVDAVVECSSGTYVRALARDLGADLGTGGHLTALRRTRVGPYGLDRARTLEELEEEFAPLGLTEAAVEAFPHWDVPRDEAKRIANGVRVEAPGMGGTEKEPVAVVSDGQLIALIEERKGKVRTLAVFVHGSEL
ncbi:tRNA pseudouridine(55) synthase TruB [Mangrovactinospora gilvigrisea]|uniref:tRNA pseudouridine synthase B n=1 Tax=Mangrovactinospora gilvigrisea TaxID=1428644 RepID=A0A1J7B9M5_9ACTN|nr:tRNA pseudouridine(55) synthase TruB [Mangrovactinospora gilvigrisea]OIV35375.1 tRNA pseudouridine(55) synthase TruB [Mangrovactinospora gilvigrisea]